jgi:hypothetical protein
MRNDLPTTPAALPPHRDDELELVVRAARSRRRASGRLLAITLGSWLVAGAAYGSLAEVGESGSAYLREEQRAARAFARVQAAAVDEDACPQTFECLFDTLEGDEVGTVGELALPSGLIGTSGPPSFDLER